ncbi:MAG: DUF362 domain-containing protein [Chloroflexi bacterium]|nr:DUF362 domain-containing protein [Chloroflexota bacterium]
MPSKLSFHISGYTSKTFDNLERVQPSVVKIYDDNSEMNVDEIRRRCSALIVYREVSDFDYHRTADEFYFLIKNSIDKLRGRGIIWEGVNEPVPDSTENAKALNKWITRFAQIMHSEGELVGGFSWSTGNPTPAMWNQIVPYMVEAAAACDFHTFHEYYNTWSQTGDWGRYRAFEQAMPAYARKPVIITECGFDMSGQMEGGYQGHITEAEYIEILKQYDQLLLQDPYVLGSTIFQWGGSQWRSFEISAIIDRIGDYMVAVGQGYRIPHPYPLPVFGPTRTFTAMPAEIQVGQSTTLQWSIDDAASVTLDGVLVPAVSSTVVTPTQTTTYTLHVVAADGTMEDLTATVTVATSATPILTNVTLTPANVAVGQLLNVSITVTNTTAQTLETQEPNPGFVYDEGDTFYTRGFPDMANAFRVGIDFEGRDKTMIDHPYRWGLGAPLAPGQSATITGAIRLKTPRSGKYWAGLVQEQVRWIQDNVGTQVVTVSPVSGAFARITQVSMTPTKLNQDQLLTVSITVQNNGNAPLVSQGPNPGFVYDEGDTFYTRGFPDTPGAFRVGVDFDGRTGIDHPYRWGLGAPLAPGETRTITGSIRLKNLQSKNYWVGLVQEATAWVQDNLGKQMVTVTPATSPHIVSVAFSPTSLASGDLLRVDFAVRNSGATTLTTQGPEPGFIYDEGDTFDSRGFAAVAGNMRVGIDFEGRTGIDHPYRWGLGAPLEPGQSTTITGYIRLKNTQSRDYWAGLVTEWVAWLQDHQGTQTITVTPSTGQPQVIHVHNRLATTWNGQQKYWEFIDQNVVNAMVERGLVDLTGTTSLADAWKKLLPNYQSGQGIAIKINMTNGGNGNLDQTIQTINAIVRGLVQRGVQPGDVWVTDPLRTFPPHFIEGNLYPGIKFYDVTVHDQTGFTSNDPNAIITSPTPPNIPTFPQVKISDVLINATYIINVPILKGHLMGAGVTLGFKNWLGATNNPSGFHPYIFPAGVYFGLDYNPLVDLNANPHIRYKSVVTIADGLFTGNDWNSPVLPMVTFGNQTPSSLFFATDPVALDSVLCDLVSAEWSVSGGADNYLRLAEARGLGVYEHRTPSGYAKIDSRRIEM